MLKRKISMAKVVLMGSPEYAIPTLEALHAHHQVVLVVTQPDRRRGRGRQLSAPPAKEAALALGLPVWQPTSLRTPEAFKRLCETGADLYVTAAIGLILPPRVLDLPVHGTLNLHASLLPRWRGAAPVSAAILHGDSETGVTLMQTDPGIDTGPIVAQVRCAIGPDDTTETLTRRLAQLGASLLTETLPRWLADEIEPRPQSETEATYAPPLTKNDGRIDWQQPAVHIARMTRAYTPWPGTFTIYEGTRLRVLRAHALPQWRGDEPPGGVFAFPDGQIAVATTEGALGLDELQLAGKKAMPAMAFSRGQRAFVGSKVG
jgi:methionyl-tRNA formyltransferase